MKIISKFRFVFIINIEEIITIALKIGQTSPGSVFHPSLCLCTGLECPGRGNQEAKSSGWWLSHGLPPIISSAQGLQECEFNMCSTEILVFNVKEGCTPSVYFGVHTTAILSILFFHAISCVWLVVIYLLKPDLGVEYQERLWEHGESERKWRAPASLWVFRDSYWQTVHILCKRWTEGISLQMMKVSGVHSCESGRTHKGPTTEQYPTSLPV